MKDSCSKCAYLVRSHTLTGTQYECRYTGTSTGPDWRCYGFSKPSIAGIAGSGWWKVGLYYVFAFFAIAWVSFVATCFILSLFN